MPVDLFEEQFENLIAEGQVDAFGDGHAKSSVEHVGLDFFKEEEVQVEVVDVVGKFLECLFVVGER